MILRCRENVHAETYALLIDTFVRDGAERDNLFNAIETSEQIRSTTREMSADTDMNSSVYSKEGSVGTALDRRRTNNVCGTPDRFRMCRRNLLLWWVSTLPSRSHQSLIAVRCPRIIRRHFLSQETRTDARTRILKRTHLPRRRSPHRLRLSPLPASRPQAVGGSSEENRQRSRRY